MHQRRQAPAASHNNVSAILARTHLSATLPVNNRTFDLAIQNRREVARYQDELVGYHRKNQLVHAQNESDARVENMRRLKRFQQQNAELAQAYKYENTVKEKQERALLAQQNEQLAEVMSQIKKEEIAKQQNDRRIWDESEELAELRSQLAAAQLNKVRATQLSEKQLLAVQEKKRNEEIEREMEYDRIAALKLEMDELEKRQMINFSAREYLQKQMAEKEIRKQLAYEQFLKEKAVIDEIVKNIEADDQKKLQVQLAKQRELQENIRTYLVERARWREEEKRRAEEELYKIQEYQKLQQARHEELMRQKQKKVDLQDRVLEKLALEIESKRKEEEEMQKLLYELYQEEAESKALEEIRKREEKVARMRREMIDANEYQKAFKAQKYAEQQREEQAFREKMIQKFHEDKRLEQMNAERRRREMQEYKREVERIIDERKKLYEEAVEREMAERAREQREREEKLRIVEAERQRLLQEYARDLKDYLPKGVFKTEADYEAVFGQKPAAQTSKGLGKQGTLHFK